MSATVAIRDTTLIGSPDPSGLAWVPDDPQNPQSGTLFLCDSEVNESPFNSSFNLFGLRTDGSLIAPYSLTGFNIEPTGLTYDPSADRLYISDDDKDRVYWVDPDAPSVKLGVFAAKLSGKYRRGGFGVRPGYGHLFISNGIHANIREVNTDGTLVRTIALPAAIPDPDGLVYDPAHDVFFIGMRSSSNIWVVDRNGTLLDTITVLANHPRPGGSKARVCDLEFARAATPTAGTR